MPELDPPSPPKGVLPADLGVEVVGRTITGVGLRDVFVGCAQSRALGIESADCTGKRRPAHRAVFPHEPPWSRTERDRQPSRQRIPFDFALNPRSRAASFCHPLCARPRKCLCRAVPYADADPPGPLGARPIRHPRWTTNLLSTDDYPKPQALQHVSAWGTNCRVPIAHFPHRFRHPPPLIQPLLQSSSLVDGLDKFHCGRRRG